MKNKQHGEVDHEICKLCESQNYDERDFKKHTRTNLRSHDELSKPEALEILEADLDNDYLVDGTEVGEDSLGMSHREENFDEERTPIECRGHNELNQNLTKQDYI